MGNVFCANAVEFGGDAHVGIHAADPCHQPGGSIFLRGGDIHGLADFQRFPVDAVTVGREYIGQEHCIGKSVGNVVLTTQGMGDSVTVAHIAFGEGTTSIEGCLQHIGPCFHIITVFEGDFKVFRNQFTSRQGVGTGLFRGGMTDVCLDGVGQCVHTGGGGKMGREAAGHLRVQHGCPGDQGKIADGEFVIIDVVGDDGCQRDLAAGSGSGGDCDEVGDGADDLQDPLHSGNGQSGAGDPGTDGFGAVDGRAAAEADQSLTAVFNVANPGNFHISNRGVGDNFIVNGAANACIFQCGLHGFQFFGTVEKAISDHHDTGDIPLCQEGGNFFDAVENLGRTVGKNGNGNFKCSLECAAVHFHDGIHNDLQMLRMQQ